MGTDKNANKLKVAVIGSGFSGLSAAAYAANAGHDVHVFEKHDAPGGRARQLSTDNGFVFDMGPSWYWMPDIIDDFFADFNTHASNFFELISLDPQFEIIFNSDKLSVPASYEELKNVFERIENGAGQKLDRFMKSAKYKYEVAMRRFISKPCKTWFEFLAPTIAVSALQLKLLTNFRSYVSSYFSDPRLVSLMEFPVIFLGAPPQNIPSMYSLMNYGGYVLGTKYPIGGFYELVKAMYSTAEKQGAKFHFNHPVEAIVTNDEEVTAIVVNGEEISFDAVIASCDYHHAETLLPQAFRNYDEKYWSSKTFAPSCLIFYLGLNTKIPNLKHHSLFFEHAMDDHIDDIYNNKKWPEKPLFYVCCPSKTDAFVAPEGCENLFLLMPLAIGLNDVEALRDSYLREMISRIEKHCGITHLFERVVYKKSYCVNDFVADYNAYGGNAYGLANTLSQTAVLKPKIKNRKLKNLIYAGQLTVPGPGVPPSIISGKIAAAEINNIKKSSYEKVL